MSDTAHQNRARPTHAAAFVFVAVALLLAIVIINPFREMCTLDDSWAYARMVQHLLATGRYHLDAWAAANMPVQIYLAAALSKIFGYSLSLLRCTTLCLFALGLVSFYLLLCELGNSRNTAAVLTLAIPASPLVLLLAFTFMSDVQFLGWLLLALLLYVRGIRRQSAWTIFFGSLAAGCAIGTRQFGAAIMIGLVVSWLLPSRNRLPIRLLLIAIFVPLMAMLAQVYFGLREPNFTQTLRLLQAHQFLSSPVRHLIKEFFWRCAVMTQYTGMALLPLLPLALALRRSFWTKRIAGIPLWLLTLLGLAALLLGLAMTSAMTARPEARHRGLHEPLEMYWLLSMQLRSIRPAMWLLDLAGLAGGTFLIAICLSSLQHLRCVRLRAEAAFLAGTGLGLFLLHLTYAQLNDTYIVALVPFALLLVGSCLQEAAEQPAMIRPALMRLFGAPCIALVLLTALPLRGEYATLEALWSSARKLTDSGVQPLDIGVPYWAEYHGLFDAWIAAGVPGYDPLHLDRYIDPLHDPYNIWRQQQWDHARYRVFVSSTLTPPPGWQVVAVRGFRSANFSREYALSLMRVPGSEQPSSTQPAAVP